MTSKAYFEHIHQARRRSQSNSFLGYMNISTSHDEEEDAANQTPCVSSANY